ncbi:hypothetical protein TRFO_11988 [Tritrichomonas foetus]|uniref:BEACH domain-containing protein n=1 Tax=Tritrichomonas foetus TaxID=1144522 RepID=A0A1J4J0V9_9EUKA|nr:hypothetical protein TRFO_11988 [Tritrichomonas foetus]|eukprot:OHS93176.1 hypothetical protein TRFO_11988 [Tritrichomonas foetus]
MVYKSKMEDALLRRECVKTIIQLFQYRREQSRFSKYPPDSPPVQLINQIPRFERSQLNKFSNEIKETMNFKSSLKVLNYKYDTKIIEEIGEITDQLNDAILIIVFYQILACLYCANKDLSSNDYQLIMSILIKPNFIDSILPQFINYSFYLLLTTAISTRSFLWSPPLIEVTSLFFLHNKNLGPEFYPLLVYFLDMMFKLEPDDKNGMVKNILGKIKKLFIKKAPIVSVKNHTQLLDILNPLLFDLNYDAVILLAIISRIDNSSFLRDIMQQLPTLFTVQIQNKTSQENCKIIVHETNQIHKHPATFQSRLPSCNFEYIPYKNITDSQKQISNISEKCRFHRDDLFALIPNSLRITISLFIDFLKVLDQSLYPLFFRKMNEALLHCVNSDSYDVFASYLFIIDSLGNESVIYENIPIFFRKPQTQRRTASDATTSPRTSPNLNLNLNKSIVIRSDYLFDPNKTIYGPYELDHNMNLFRAAIVDIIFTKCQKLIPTLLNSTDGQPFLMAEMISRYSFYKNSNQFLCDDMIYKCMAKQAINLHTFEADLLPRDAFFLFFGQFLENEKCFGKCLSSTVFVDCFFRSIFEERYTKPLLHLIYKSIVMIEDSKDSQQIKPTVNFLFKSVRIRQLAPLIFDMVTKIILYRPFMIPLFRIFNEPLLENLSQNPSQESFNNAVTMLAEYSKYISNYTLASRHFQILSRFVKDFGNFTLLNNLIIGSHSLPKTSFYVIRKPAFLPLFFVAFQDDHDSLIEVLKMFKKLSLISDYNKRALHDGCVDFILLQFLKNFNIENPNNENTHVNSFVFNGVKIQLNFAEQDIRSHILLLLTLICKAKTNGVVTKEIVNLITKTQNYDIALLANKVISDNSLTHNPYFLVGTLSPFLTINGLDHNVFEGQFTITFWMKTDPVLLGHSTASIILFSVIDCENRHEFSIVLEGNTLYCAYDNETQRTIVGVCQRMNLTEWAHFIIVFPNEHSKAGKMLLSTYQNFDKLSDSVFTSLEFTPGPVTVKLGGCSFKKHSPIFPDEIFAYIGRFSIYPRLLDKDEMVLVLLQDITAPKDYIFTVNDFDSSMINQVIKTKFKSFELEKIYQNNYYPIESLAQSLSNDKYIEILINSIPKLTKKLMYSALNIIEKTISITTNKQLSAIFASYLFSMEIDYNLFKQLYSIALNISDKTTQRYWVEDIIANCSLWAKSPSFQQILYDYSTILLTDYANDIWSKKSYFPYFLNYFHKHCYIEKNISHMESFSLFIERLSYVKFEIDDIRLLLSYIADSPDNFIVIYLDMIRLMAKPINGTEFKALANLAQFLSSNNPQIVVAAILALNELLNDKFHTSIVFIIKQVTISKELLFNQLNQKIMGSPNIFPLMCAIAIETHQKPDKIPQTVVLSDYWYLFPLFLSLLFEDNTKLIDFIATNALKSRHLNEIFKLTTFLNVLAEFSCENPLHQLLRSMMESSKEVTNVEILFKIFFFSLASYFYHLNAPLRHTSLFTQEQLSLPESISLYQPKEITKMKITGIDSIRDFSSISFKDIPLIFYLEYDENEKTQVQGKLADYSLLTEANAISHDLINYKLKGVSKHSSGSFLSNTKVPDFDIKDIKNLIDSIIQMETRTKSLTEYQKRYKIYNYIGKVLKTVLGKEDSIKNIRKLFFEIPIAQQSAGNSSNFASKEAVRISKQSLIVNNKSTMKRSSAVCYSFCPFKDERIKETRNIRRFKLKPIQIEGNCSIIQLTQKIPAVVTIEKESESNKFIRIRTKKFTLILYDDDILNIYYINENMVLLITTENEPILIDFSPSKNEGFLTEMNPERNYKISLESLIALIPQLEKEWLSHNISTFKYINYLNLLSGRVYENPSLYPLFPPPWEIHDFTSLNNEVDSTVIWNYSNQDIAKLSDYKNNLFIPPEFYFSYDHLDNVYENRKKLENNNSVNIWITKVFGTNDYQHIRLLSSKHPEREPLNPNATSQVSQQISFSDNEIPIPITFAASTFYENGFVVIYNSGEVKFTQVVFDETGKATLKTVTAKEKVKFGKQQTFAYFNTGMISGITASQTNSITFGIISVDKNSVTVFTDRSVIHYDNVYLSNPIFSASIFLATPSLIAKTSYFLSPTNNQFSQKALYHVHSRITCLECSNVFSIIALGCEDGKVRIRSLKDGKKISTVNLNNEIPVKILITDCWGFILVKTVSKLYLLSVNGKLLKTMSSFKRFNQWFAFHTSDDFDYIAIVDENRHILCFEAMNPENMELVGECPSLKVIRYDPKAECFLVVLSDGRLFVFPHKINQSK